MRGFGDMSGAAGLSGAAMAATAADAADEETSGGPVPERIAFFGHDAIESTVIKRARMFQAGGSNVVGFMFRRERAGRSRPDDWDNIDLGVTVDRNYLARLPKLFLGIARAVRHGRELRRCDAIYARNIDMLFVAVIAKVLTGSKAPVAYEVLDVRRIFLGSSTASRAFRWAERRLMRAVALLVVSAPDYITHYFAPVQRFDGAWFLLENKLPPHAAEAALARAAQPLPPGPPWTIGMFGVLKCARSFKILCDLAGRLGEKAVIYLRGVPSETDIPSKDIRAACAAHCNIIFEGPYNNPQDLPDIYGRIHFIWAADYLDPGGNSQWCLANRIYEGALMGAVMIAAKDNATGRKVEEEGLGFTLAEPVEESAAELMETMTPERYLAARAKVRAADPALFIDRTDTLRLLRLLRCVAASNLTERGGLTDLS